MAHWGLTWLPPRPRRHRSLQCRAVCASDVEHREALALADADAQQRHRAFGVHDLLQLDGLAPRGTAKLSSGVNVAMAD